MDSFIWILPQQIAAAQKPGLLGTLYRDLAYLQARRIRTIVSLTVDPLEIPDAFGFQQIHFPISDMGITTPASCLDLCRQIFASVDAENRTLIYCRTGLGRTGVIATCLLITQGLSAAAAIRQAREINPYFILTPEQEKFVLDFAALVAEVADVLQRLLAQMDTSGQPLSSTALNSETFLPKEARRRSCQ